MNDERPAKYCQHGICRTDTLEELVALGLATRRRDVLDAANHTMQATVRCRLLPRKGPVRAPLPGPC